MRLGVLFEAAPGLSWHRDEPPPSPVGSLCVGGGFLVHRPHGDGTIGIFMLARHMSVVGRVHASGATVT